MNYAERVKVLMQHAAYDDAPNLWIELHTAIDAMQSALDDAAAARDAWAERWLKSAQKSDELKVKLAARDAEVERLTKDVERYQLVRRGQHWSVIFVIDGIGNELRGEALDAAIDTVIVRKLATAPPDEVKDDWIEYRGRDDAALDEEVKGGV